jgi:hypothetical protein
MTYFKRKLPNMHTALKRILLNLVLDIVPRDNIHGSSPNAAAISSKFREVKVCNQETDECETDEYVRSSFDRWS